MSKIYLCDCGSQSKVCGGTHAPGGPDTSMSKLLSICTGKQTAVYACTNCGQWARPTSTPEKVTWDCVNECAKRGFADNHEEVK